MNANSLVPNAARILLALALVAAIAPLASAQDGGQQEYRSFNFYFNYGRNPGECSGNCQAACLSACYQAAAGLTGIRCICDTCSSACGQAFSGCGGQIVCSKPVNPQYSPAETGTTMTPDSVPLFPSLDNGQYIGGPGVQLGESEEEIARQAEAEQAERERQAQYRLDMCSNNRECNQCANSVYKCNWNGVACLPCDVSCKSFCPNGQREPPNQPVPTAPPSYVVPKGDISVIRSTPTPAAGPTEPTPTPAPTCGTFDSCSACVNSQVAKEGRCGWSDFLGACINPAQASQAGMFDVKSGWTTNASSCKSAEEKLSCSTFNNCFSCAGVGGVKRSCQWSVPDNACEQYSGNSDFVTPENKAGTAIAFPGFCPKHDCSQYDNCSKCAANSRCSWDPEKGECGEYLGQTGGIIYPRWCPAGESAKRFSYCPEGCECDDSGFIANCSDRQLGNASIVSARSAALTAWAGSPIGEISSVKLVGEGSDASYVVTGKRTTTILFIIPADYEATATVNATTGAITKIDKPWWAFLAG